MEYLRTLGSAAVSSLVQKSGLNLPFTLGSKVTSFENVWNLYDATKRDDGSSVSVFEYDNRSTVLLAKNALRKLRTTRHPDVLKFIDAVESETVIYIVTERVRPLTTSLPSWSSRDATEREDWLLWGLHRISVALAFVNDSCASSHGNVRVNSCFISPSGEWKLGGFELLSNPKDESAVLYTMGGTVPLASDWVPPEVRKGGYTTLKDHHPAAVDAYALGLLLHTVFNPNQGPHPTLQPPHTPPQPSSRGSIPTSIFPSFKKLLNPNPKIRMTPQNFLAVGMAETAGEGSGFFVHNRLVKVCMGLDNFSLGSETEKTSFLRALKESASTFPTEFASFRVLPSLVSALEFGGASAAAILPLVLQLGNNVAPEDYSTVILAPLTKLYASPDRGTRMALLDHLPEYIDKLDKKVVADKIWPHLQTGFLDTVAVIREATVKSISVFAPKFTDRILNNDLLRFLAKMQSDPESSIRANTCILIGRLAPSLGYNTKRKMLVPAFARAIKDLFVHARVAGIMAFMATIDCFDSSELATRVLPNISPVLIDSEKLVRDQAFQAVHLFVKRLEAHAATMPDTAISDEFNVPGSLITSMPTQATLVNTAAGAAGTLAGWALSSLGKKLVPTDLQSVMGSAIERPSSAPVAIAGASTDTATVSHGQPTLTASSSTRSTSTPSTSRGKGMQLGANKVTAGAATVTLAAQLADEVAAEEGADGNPWGTEDLIDINADEDDWSAFETAPTHERASTSDRNVTTNDTASQGTTESSHPVIPGAYSDIDPWRATSKNGISHLKQPEIVDPWRRPALELGTNPHPTLSSHPSSNVSSHHSSSQPSLVSSHPPLNGLNTATRLQTAASSTSGMNREEKAAEMARRKEERKQRIAQLKEQKKNINAKS